MSDATISLNAAQLQLIVSTAVSAALAASGSITQPKAVRAARSPAIRDDASASPMDPAKAEKAAKYLQSKKDVALKLMREKGVHYGVFQKNRKYLVWSDLTYDKARREGRPESLGTRVWSTVEVESLGGQPMGQGATTA